MPAVVVITVVILGNFRFFSAGLPGRQEIIKEIMGGVGLAFRPGTGAGRPLEKNPKFPQIQNFQNFQNLLLLQQQQQPAYF